jgi:hypothetical protein
MVERMSVDQYNRAPFAGNLAINIYTIDFCDHSNNLFFDFTVMGLIKPVTRI